MRFIVNSQTPQYYVKLCNPKELNTSINCIFEIRNKKTTMKKIAFLLVSIVLFSCSDEQKDYLTISGTIENSTVKTISIENQKYKKELSVDETGHFKDTLHLKNIELLASYQENFYVISVGQNKSLSYLQNGFDIKLTVKGNDFNFKGKGSENTNYIKEKMEITKSAMTIPEYFKLEKDSFDTKLAEAKATFGGLLNKYKNIDPAFKTAETANNQQFYSTLTDNYKEQHSLLKNTQKGSPSPVFNNYENYKGGTSSLADFKGKYVYIDVWATWCGPCKQQIPYLQSLEEKYHNKNIEFVSISVDQPNKKEDWKKMISDKKMSGVQLFANNDPGFQQAYQISGIPRFILIDPQGNIVDANAPRPSDPNLTSIFTELGL